MKKVRYIGSEGIADSTEKLKRIQELAGISKKTITESKGTGSSLLHEVTTADGQTFGLVQEGGKVFIKTLVGENYQYIGGLENKTDYKFDSYAQSVKELNIIIKNINSEMGNPNTTLLKKK